MADGTTTNPADLPEYKGFLGNLKYQRKVYFNVFYRWADIMRSLDESGVSKWSRADEQQFAAEGTDQANKRLGDVARARDLTLAGTAVFMAGAAAFGWRVGQRRIIPGIPIGALIGFPIGYLTSDLMTSTVYGTWKYDTLDVWEKFATWYVGKARAEAEGTQ